MFNIHKCMIHHFNQWISADAKMYHTCVQGMSQYFFKVLNTQYQYSKKILLNTQYFNTFSHLKCIENTNTNINTQYIHFSDVLLLQWFSCTFRYLYSLELTKVWFSCNNNCFSKLSRGVNVSQSLNSNSLILAFTCKLSGICPLFGILPSFARA